MNFLLGTETWSINIQNQQTFGLAYIDIPTEVIVPGGVQIWKIVHNGIASHHLTWQLCDVQLINRTHWDGTLVPPDPNELGWKNTIRVDGLQDTYIAIKPKTPTIPFPLPNSSRALDVTSPIGSTTGFTLLNGQTTPTVNAITDFGWEYAWFGHQMGHNENDMMRPMTLMATPTGGADTVPPTVTASVAPAANAAGWNNVAPTVTLNATDNVGGLGVASITYSATGAQAIASTTVTGTTATLTTTIPINVNGVTTITYFATDLALNSSVPQTLVVSLDTTAPTATIALNPTALSANSGTVNVTVSGSITDTVSGVDPATAAYSVGDSAVLVQPSGPITLAANGSYSFTVSLDTKLIRPSRTRTYTITVKASDKAGNFGTARATIIAR